MAIAEKYAILFQRECLILSNIVQNNLNKLIINPKDKEALEKMIQAADTIIGDSRFINYKELENASMMLVKSFNELKDATGKLSELEFFSKIFNKIISR